MAWKHTRAHTHTHTHAQDYVGSNNINLLVPSGQFGTRLQVRQRLS